MINVTVLITTLNEAGNLPRCLKALKDFDDVIVIDSASVDDTAEIARAHGARVENFQWNKAYPKKRQWCLDNIQTKNDYIFFVDADEEVNPALIEEIKSLSFKAAGYFVKGQYCWHGKLLRYGLKNNKLVLFDKNKIEFPVIGDLGDFCMGEMEGHYQPVLKTAFQGEPIGQLLSPLCHFAYEEVGAWQARHQRYAIWEAGMIERGAYPRENNQWRDILKRIFRKLPLRGEIAFAHSYLMKLGFLDGRVGLDFALSRRRYYVEVANALKASRA